eukprot:538000-Hanusia_phi.AAC.1
MKKRLLVAGREAAPEEQQRNLSGERLRGSDQTARRLVRHQRVPGEKPQGGYSALSMRQKGSFPPLSNTKGG